MLQAFLLLLRAFVRGRVFLLLVAATALVFTLGPDFVRSDGTAAGALEMWIRAVPGGVNAILALTVLCTACGFFAHEREAKRLALTVVRPARAFGIACGSWLALMAGALGILILSSALTLVLAPGTALPPCRHHYAPAMPPASEVAAHLLESYLADPKTPENVRKASRRSVLTLLTTKEIDRYDVIRPGAEVTWPYALPPLAEDVSSGADLSLSVRFATAFEMRASVRGRFTLGPYAATLTNNTQSVLEIPLARTAAQTPSGRLDLTFANTGKTAVMVRPRRDLEVLAPGDAFAWNLLRAQIEVLALVGIMAAFGLFLSAALSRPVAIFVALVTCAIVLMAPSVVVQFPDEFNAAFADRLGLAMARGVSLVTASLADPSPMADLATGRYVELPELLRTCCADLVIGPLILLSATAFILRRKPLSDTE